jgi:hypothetical protein
MAKKLTTSLMQKLVQTNNDEYSSEETETIIEQVTELVKVTTSQNTTVKAAMSMIHEYEKSKELVELASKKFKSTLF